MKFLCALHSSCDAFNIVCVCLCGNSSTLTLYANLNVIAQSHAGQIKTSPMCGKGISARWGGDTPPPPPPPPLPPPPPMPDMAQFWAYAVQFMMGFMMSWMVVMPRQGEHHETIGHAPTDTYEHNPSCFLSTEEAIFWLWFQAPWKRDAFAIPNNINVPQCIKYEKSHLGVCLYESRLCF